MVKDFRYTADGKDESPLFDVKRFCIRCGREVEDKDLYRSHTKMHKGFKDKIPWCRSCLEVVYEKYLRKYKKEIETMQKEFGIDKVEEFYAERKAIRRICMMCDLYFSDIVFNSVIKQKKNLTAMDGLMRTQNLVQNRNRTFDDTLENEIYEEYKKMKDEQENIDGIPASTIRFFGKGFIKEDYEFLQREYDDWTSRHECNTKSQEEIIKDICFNRLQNLKALREGEDTKDITAAFQKLLNSGKLEPKQNHGDSMSEGQTFGTLIDKWENTAPISEVAEEFKDVNKIGLYVDTFYKGHAAKMLGVKNAYSALYDKVMSLDTVKKPEYKDVEDSEAIFEAIFGSDNVIESLDEDVQPPIEVFEDS